MIIILQAWKHLELAIYRQYKEHMTRTEMTSLILFLEYQQAFALYDRNADGTIDEDELLSVLRSLGQNPTEQEVHDILNQVCKTSQMI